MRKQAGHTHCCTSCSGRCSVQTPKNTSSDKVPKELEAEAFPGGQRAHYIVVYGRLRVLIIVMFYLICFGKIKFLLLLLFYANDPKKSV